MKKQVQQCILLIVCVIMSGNAYGQLSAPGGATTSSTNGWSNHLKAPRGSLPPATLGTDLVINYFNPLIPTIGIVGPDQVGADIVPTYGERITMPSSDGYLDSVQITLDTITGDSILVYLIADTLYSTGQGEFHLMNIFDPNAETYEIGYIQANAIHGRTMVTLAMPHTQINMQDFWIAVEPNFDQSAEVFTNAFRLIGDSESIEPRSTNNSRSGFLAELNTGQIESALFDSTFLSTSSQPLYSNFYITAFVSSSSSIVTNNNASPAISVFPNPASTSLQIQGLIGTSNVELLDLLGRTVLSAQISGDGKLDVSQLQPGRYEAIIHSASWVMTSPIIIQR